jgi:hypothetical protein
VFTFFSAAATTSVDVHGKLARLSKSNPAAMAVTPGPDARCTVRAAWKAAVAGGLAPTPGITVVYMHDLSLNIPAWTFTTPRIRYVVDARTCTLKSGKG